MIVLNISDTKHRIVFIGLPTFFYRCVRGWDSSELGKFKIFAKTSEKEKEQRKKQRKKGEKHRKKQQKNGGKSGFGR